MRASAILLRQTRHFQLYGKRSPRNFYKGTRTGRMGNHTKYGAYVVDYDLVRTYVVPDAIDACKLTPFVTNRIRPVRGEYGSKENLPISGHYFMRRWKEENGED